MYFFFVREPIFETGVLYVRADGEPEKPGELG